MIQLFYVFSDWGLLALRLALGAIFLVHGWRKIKDMKGTAEAFQGMGFKPGKFWATLVALLEFVGGIAFIIGLLTQVFAALLAIEFIVILVKVKKFKQFVGGYEFDLLILAALLALCTLGGGSASADSFFGLLFY